MRGAVIGGRLPDFLVIGGQRCGTTSFHEGLTSLPGVGRAAEKEVHYFDLRYERGDDWYREQFPGDSLLAGEASPYYIFHPLVPGRVARTLPHVKLIALLRDPVARACSHYHHEARDGREDLPFEKALDREEERLASETGKLRSGSDWAASHHRTHSYVSRGRWAEQLERWWKVIPPERMLVLFSEEYFADPLSTLRAVAAFLGCPFPSKDDLCRAGTAVERSLAAVPARPPIAPPVRERLHRAFAASDDALARLLGRRPPWIRTP